MKKKQLKKVSYLTLGVLSTTTIVVAPTLATTLKANSNVNHGVTDANVTTKTNVNHFNRLLTSDLATDTNQSLTLISGLVAGINW